MTTQWILEHIALAHYVDPAHIKSRDRRQKTVALRHLAMYLARELTTDSLPVIARHLGLRDHTTVIHGVRKVSEQIQIDARFREEVLHWSAFVTDSFEKFLENEHRERLSA